MADKKKAPEPKKGKEQKGLPPWLKPMDGMKESKGISKKAPKKKK